MALDVVVGLLILGGTAGWLLGLTVTHQLLEHVYERAYRLGLQHGRQLAHVRDAVIDDLTPVGSPHG
jgi:hypothetical protein